MTKKIALELTEPQDRFVFSKARHPAMVAGYGAGKSQAAAVRIAMLALKYPGFSFGFVEPTFDLVRLIAWPRFADLFEQWGVGFELNKSESILYLSNKSQIIFRSADRPERMVGFEIADGVIDEADTLRQDQAQDVWVKMLGRCRQKKPDGSINTLAAVSTPEGHGWMYKTWGKEQREGYELIKAPTSSNPYLPAGYIDQLKATYGSAQLMAYLEGEFTNLNSGSVYPAFDRNAAYTNATVKAGEPIHAGLDFNVTNCSAVIFVIRDGKPIAVDELTGVYDTPDLARIIRSRYENHKIFVYPDASGANRKSNNASVSDIAILEQAKFVVCKNAANPRVKDRVLSVNKLIKDGDLKINTDACPHFTEGLERQSYDKNGEPDKQGGFDHVNDAAGYFIAYRYPIAKRTAVAKQLII